MSLVESNSICHFSAFLTVVVNLAPDGRTLLILKFSWGSMPRPLVGEWGKCLPSLPTRANKKKQPLSNTGYRGWIEVSREESTMKEWE